MFKIYTSDPTEWKRLNIHAFKKDLHQLLYGLDNLRRSYSLKDWESFCYDEAIKHSIHKKLLEDPYTKRAFEKPRGYAGDAVMMDYIYGINSPFNQLEESIGKTVFDFTTQADPAQAVRFRRNFIAESIKKKVKANDEPIKVLSLASGYLREANLLQDEDFIFEEYLAVDHDEESLNVVKEAYEDMGVSILKGNVFKLLKENWDLGEYDFIYAAGLFDYLNIFQAKQLIQWMFKSLNHKGIMLVPNFRKEIPNSIYRTYMEAFMHWFLEYRSDEEVIALFEDLDEGEIKDFSISTDHTCNICFAQLIKH